MNRTARPLVESALLAALGAVFILISFYVPLLGVFATIVSPLPAGFIVIRHNLRWGFLSSIVTLLVLLPFISPFTAIGLWAVYGAMGMALGYSVTKELSPERSITLMAAATLVGTIVSFAGGYLATGFTLGQLADETVKALQLALAANEKLLGPNPIMDEMAKTLTREFFFRVLPASLILGAFVTAWMNFEIFRRILPRFGHSMKPLSPFSRWIMPEVFGHLWLLSTIALWTQQLYSARFPALVVIVENVYAPVSLLMFADALAALSFYLQRSGISKGLSGLMVFMAASMAFSSQALLLLAQLFGMIDVLFDLRRLRYPELQDRL
ncbi:MAG: DUF2232 domain-containing protein [Bacillota bacterium]